MVSHINMDESDILEPFIELLELFYKCVLDGLESSVVPNLNENCTHFLPPGISEQTALFTRFMTCASVITQAFEVKGWFHRHYK